MRNRTVGTIYYEKNDGIQNVSIWRRLSQGNGKIRSWAGGLGFIILFTVVAYYIVTSIALPHMQKLDRAVEFGTITEETDQK